MTLLPLRLPTAALMTLALVTTAGCSLPGRNPSPEPAEAFENVALVPETGVYLGVFYGDGTAQTTDEAIGRTPQIDLTYFGWEDDWAESAALADDAERGQISLVNWEPFDVDFDDIVAGNFDDMLTERAREASRLPGPVFVDFAAEMNEEEGWGGHDPELYIAAYRHVHDVFEGEDDGNVVWVWAPNNVDSEDAPAALDYYPGDDYVDWTGIDGYNWGTAEAGFQWQSFEEVFRDLYDDLHALGKPIIIGETASADEGGNKQEWIGEIAPTLQNEFSDIRAVVWFDVNKERDWRVRSSSASLSAFRELAADPLFQTPSV